MKNRDTINPTSIDYAIMGLLYQKPRSGYGIQEAFKKSVIGKYSSSPGTIYPALKRMQSSGLIQNSSEGEGKKTPYKLSSRGKVFLTAWLLAPISKEDIRKRLNELILRFALMDELISRTEIRHFLSSFMDQARSYIAQLEQNFKDSTGSLSSHEKLCIEHNISHYKASLRWAKKTLNHINGLQ